MASNQIQEALPFLPPDGELRKQCAEWAAKMNPKDAGELIRKASGIYRWITQESEPTNG